MLANLAVLGAPLVHAFGRLGRRANRLLTWPRARFWAGLLCALYVVAYVYVIAQGKPPLNASGAPIGGDYIAFHAAGLLLLAGQGPHLYDHAALEAVQAELLHGLAPGFYDAFRNPPFAALPFAPLALLDLLPGFIAWSLTSLACLSLSLWLLLQDLPELQPRWRGLLVLVFAFAPVYFGIIDGENATLSLLLYVLIYRALLRAQPGRAGIWAALGLFKPQLFFVFPLIFVASRRWRALATYVLTALLLGAICLALVGLDGLQAWLRILVEPETGNAQANAWRMASLKSFFDLLVPVQQPPIALAVYLVLLALLVYAFFTAWMDRYLPPKLVWIFTSLVAVLIDPHLVDYDLSVLVPAGVFAALTIPSARWLIAALYVVVLFRAQLPLGSTAVQLTTPFLMACLVLVWTRFAHSGPHASSASFAACAAHNLH